MNRSAVAFVLAPAFLFIGGCNHDHGQQAIVHPANLPRHLHLPASARPGAALFQQLPCLACHTYRGAGEANLNAPSLTAEGTKHRGIGWQIRHLECPSCVVAGSAMPSFAALPRRDLRKLAVFLEASKGHK
jgi:cytochrome c2